MKLSKIVCSAEYPESSAMGFILTFVATLSYIEHLDLWS